MCVGDCRDRGSCSCLSVFFAVIYSKVQDVVYVQPLGIKAIQRGFLVHSVPVINLPNKLYVLSQLLLP